jgi:iron(III) transport system ATP-binding protein
VVAIRLENVSKDFGVVRAVDEAELNIGRGRLFFLLGPSGCGKTTILRMIAGFTPPTSGRIRFDDRDVTHLPPHRRNAAMVFQNYALWPHMTVIQNVAYGLEVRKVPRRDRVRRVGEALELVRMGHYGERYPHELSGGQQQRVAVARALVVQPDVLLMDEPLSNLDARLRIEMRREIARIHAETRLTIVYVTHDQEEALCLAQDIAVLDSGRVHQVGAPRDVYLRPADRTVAEFLGELNTFPGTVFSDTPPLIRTDSGDFRSAALSLPPGREVLCGFRPESVTPSPPPDAPNRMTGRVRSAVFTGQTVQYDVELAGGRTVKAFVLSTGAPDYPVGTELTFAVDPARLILLPRDQ